MKCLILSDSHGRAYNVERVLSMHPDAEAVFFLGDGLSDIAELRSKYPAKAWLFVSGNCDPTYGASLVAEKIGSITLFGKKIIYCHGDLIGVKYGVDGALDYTKKNGADVLLFGHTHTPLEKYVDGVYLFNPGSISGSGGAPSYGLMNITDAGVLFSHGVLRY